MATARKRRYKPEEYLELERAADYKSEYIDGEIYAMTGGSEEHNVITGNIFAALHTQLQDRPCRVYVNDMRVGVSAAEMYTYPDVVAVCGPRLFAEGQRDTLLNPTVICEVLSPSTEAYDRGYKFAYYRRLESLTDYVLIAQDRVWVEHHGLRNGIWQLVNEASDLADNIRLPAIDCTLTLAEIYRKVEVPDPPPAPPGH
jgi:Uma2 family endonuclease